LVYLLTERTWRDWTVNV